MKICLVLLLLLPLCSAQFLIHCYGNDFLMVNNMQLDCAGKVKQACYTKRNNEKGCTPLKNCSRDGWTCCYTDYCNA
uniref:Uncharacterized protein n=1 Tax=Mola mola TaxID=94237 RepID=A0A3Q3WN11_MOLML